METGTFDHVRVDIDEEGITMVSGVSKRGEYSSFATHENGMPRSVSSQMDAAVKMSRELDVPLVRVNHGLIDRVLSVRQERGF